MVLETIRAGAPQQTFILGGNGMLEMVHTDACATSKVSLVGGAKYIITFIDDFQAC